MYTFRKNERLANYRLGKILFGDGKHFFRYPFRVHYLCLGRDQADALYGQGGARPDSLRFRYPAKCLIAVSARQVKRASDRNLAKRRIKESYRKNKKELYPFLDKEGVRCLIGLVYVARTVMGQDLIEGHVRTILKQLQEQIGKEMADSPAGAGGSLK